MRTRKRKRRKRGGGDRPCRLARPPALQSRSPYSLAVSLALQPCRLARPPALPSRPSRPSRSSCPPDCCTRPNASVCVCSGGGDDDRAGPCGALCTRPNACCCSTTAAWGHGRVVHEHLAGAAHRLVRGAPAKPHGGRAPGNGTVRRPCPEQGPGAAQHRLFDAAAGRHLPVPAGELLPRPGRPARPARWVGGAMAPLPAAGSRTLTDAGGRGACARACA